jgi:hypothetical protein
MNLANDSALGIVRVLPPIRHEMKYGDAWSVAVETGFLIIGDRPSTSALKARTMPNRDKQNALFERLGCHASSVNFLFDSA